ncbi:MAG: formimidoylglutamase [Deltaproteobacteria bacterium]|nr:formimidoylglutamase [Deltaproteobacteria bacterium]
MGRVSDTDRLATMLCSHLQALDDPQQCPAGAVVLIGVPDDRGVAINHGRVGAAQGPGAFREAFLRLPCGRDDALRRLPLYDAGDVVLGETNAETHEHLAEVVAAVVARQALPIVIGGGHDHTFGGIKGTVHAAKHVGVINIDAHLDLREPEPDGSYGSGTPFRRLIDAQHIAGPQLVEFGYQSHANHRALFDYAVAHQIRLWSWADGRGRSPETFLHLCHDLQQRYQQIAVSLDLDAIAAAEAPGVSAPAAIGLSAREVLELLQITAQQPGLSYLDIMELNPTYDPDGRTARLAAVLLWQFLSAWEAR